MPSYNQAHRTNFPLEGDLSTMYLLDFLPNHAAQAIAALAIMLFAGFWMTRLTKAMRLPNVTGYILSGVLIGPYVLRIASPATVEQMGFVTDIALAFIAFGVGKYFRFSRLKQNGWRVIVLTLFEALTAAVLITLCMITLFRLPVSFALLLGAIGSATAPASTIMTIRQYKAKGPFVDLVLQIVALDDAVALIAFSVCAAIVQAGTAGVASPSAIYLPILYNLGALALGVGGAYLLRALVDGKQRSSDHRLALTIAIVLSITGACTALDISPLLPCMVLGMVYINIGGTERLFAQIDAFTPPILLLFFVLSGMRLNLPSLSVAGVAGVAYFLIRIAGKYLGAYLGCACCRMPAHIQRNLGLALIPQAGVSIGLAVLGQRILPAELGTLLSTIILSSGLLYEMIGPACAKASLFLSHAIAKPVPPNAASPQGPSQAGQSPAASASVSRTAPASSVAATHK